MESAGFPRFGDESGVTERNYLLDHPIYTTSSLRSFRHRDDEMEATRAADTNGRSEIAYP